MANSLTIDIEKISLDTVSNAGIELSMACLDLNNLLASGNKIYKLHPHLEFAKNNNYKTLLSFGGAYSNHIHALALMAKEHGFNSIGIIRGEPEYANNPTLLDAQSAGMRLEFVNRTDYKLRNDKQYLEVLQQSYPDALIIPEGGSSQLAIKGCTQITSDLNAIQNSDIIAVACGTGATLAGVVCGLSDQQQAIGYAVLKDQSINQRVADFIANEGMQNSSYSIEAADYGGYAKLDKKLFNFILDWLDLTGILLDPIYTSKMAKRLMQQIEAEEFAPGTSITMTHSGGLQGWRGMQQRVVELAGESSWAWINRYL